MKARKPLFTRTCGASLGLTSPPFPVIKFQGYSKLEPRLGLHRTGHFWGPTCKSSGDNQSTVVTARKAVVSMKQWPPKKLIASMLTLQRGSVIAGTECASSPLSRTISCRCRRPTQPQHPEVRRTFPWRVQCSTCSRSNAPNDAWHIFATSTLTKQQAETVSLLTDGFGDWALTDHRHKKENDVKALHCVMLLKTRLS